VIIIAFLVSAFIWQVNASWGNTLPVLVIASTLVFLTVFAPFEIYFAFRDIWFERWNSLYLKDLEISKIKIMVDGGFLFANLIKAKDENVVKLKNAIIVISHGFSDTKEKLQYLYFPLAYQGYVILTYDARGIGESKTLGHRADFIKRIDDFNQIVQWVEVNNSLNKLRIYAIGISIGAITVLCGGFPNTVVEKIVAISAMSHYKKNLTSANKLVKLSYHLKGVDLSPDEEINLKLSPYFVFEKSKKDLSDSEWKKLSGKVMLIHAKNDRIIPFINFEENHSILDLDEDNILVLKKGGHMQKRNEVSIVGAVLRFLNG